MLYDFKKLLFLGIWIISYILYIILGIIQSVEMGKSHSHNLQKHSDCMKIINNLVLYSVLFRFGHIRRSDQCAVYILYSKISTDPGPLKIRHSHRFVAGVIQFLIPLE